ncbi:16S rRNA (uracil(1498)-N(3))-methyltransferase [Nocardioides sp.]|uniref:16S rRNA (uracil(1498)-N(3))-methyltransferase n=1 Tax=Nocardioides sp. TaxID=35761 RepID=UPI00356258E3
MTLPVHLVPSLSDTQVGGTVLVEGDEAHHAVVVRRLRIGEQVMLTDGHGATVIGSVAATSKRAMEVTAESVDVVPEPTPEFVVVQALPKGDRGELAVEMLTEVGAGVIVPWAAARSVAVWKGERAEKSHARWCSTAREAAKQARRPWHPSVAPLATTVDVTRLVAEADLAVLLHEDAAGSLASLEAPESGRIVVIVGPEGGLSEEELVTFEAAGATAVRLGSEVLRTSTAGVAAVSALLSRTARWR